MTDARWWPVHGHSMWPLRAGMAVRVTSAEDATVGDLVVFIAADGLSVFVHRVIHCTTTDLVTRGDTNPYDDPPVPRAAVIGRVDAIRWGPLRLPLPATGLPAAAQRRFGLRWASVAPQLRSRWRLWRKV